MIPLSKTLDLADFDQLTEELHVVDARFRDASEQHPMRRWEYALALHALRYYETQGIDPHVNLIVDVGGAGSPFWHMLHDEGYPRTQVIDPKENCTLQRYLRENAALADAVFCISVLEHVKDLDRFCYHLSCLVAPGGLLFLTVDFCDGPTILPACTVDDRYHFHWDRQRIFNPYTHGQLTSLFLRRDFELLGPADFSWHGTHIADDRNMPETAYTFASLALIKRP